MDARVSSYHVSPFGQMTLTGNTSPGTGVTPLDNSASSDGQNLYAFEAVSGSDRLGEFSIGANGALTSVGTQALPTGSEGVAAS